MPEYEVAVTDYVFPDLDTERRILSENNAEMIIAQCKNADEVISIAKNADILGHLPACPQQGTLNLATSEICSVKNAIGRMPALTTEIIFPFDLGKTNAIIDQLFDYSRAAQDYPVNNIAVTQPATGF